MTLKSMTGFARTTGANETARWTFEVRSVNGRGLDLRFRLPPGFETLEPSLREAAGKYLSRGNVSVSLTVETPGSSAQVRINQTVLAQVIEAANALAAKGIQRARADGLLALRGVLELADDSVDEAKFAARNSAILQSFEAAIRDLAAARAAEGARLKAILAQQIGEVARLVGEVASSPSRTPSAIAQRLKDQIVRLTGSNDGLDPQRLYQEAVLIATRADVAEELDRLTLHVAATKELLDNGAGAGRRLDFLAQEFNREANTLCSKANAPDVSRAGLALKTVIDQMREQVQNIE